MEELSDAGSIPARSIKPPLSILIEDSGGLFLLQRYIKWTGDARLLSTQSSKY